MKRSMPKAAFIKNWSQHMADRRIFRQLIVLLRPYWRWLVIAVLLNLITIGSSVALMGTSGWLIAKASLQPSIAALNLSIVSVRFFGIMRGVFRYGERMASHEITFRLLKDLRVWFYNALEPLAPARLMDYRSGDLLSRIINDIETIEHFYIRVVAPPIVALLIALSMIIAMGFFSIWLVLLMFISMSIMGVVLPLLTWRVRDEHLSAEQAKLNEKLLDGVSGVGDLLAFGAEERFYDQLLAQQHRVRQRQERFTRLNSILDGAGAGVINLTVVAAMIIAIPILDDPIYLAPIALAIIASFEAFIPLSVATNYLGYTLSAGNRLFEIIDAEPTVTDPAQPLAPPPSQTIEFKDITFRYQADLAPALRQLTLTIQPAETVAVVGASGAGKSSLVNLLMRFWDYQDGEILLGGKSLRAYDQATIRAQIGVIQQKTHLFNTTIRENIGMAKPSATEADIIRAAQNARIHDFISQLPQGYKTRVGESGVQLSGGERQRIALARVLLKDAPILILDEAFANLDAVNEVALLATIQDIWTDRSLLFITHRLVGMERVDRILVLRQGELVQSGTHADLLATEGLYQDMWEHQRRVLPDA